MSRALPPLNSLRAFEAAARHGNFARAAEELNVTPGALSHQVRSLEALLGGALFERQARGVALTAQGQALYPGLMTAFALIRDSVNALRTRGNSRVLVVSTPPGFTSKWLAPRLHRFMQAHPDIELRIASSATYANFAGDGVDAAIRNVPDTEVRSPALAYDKLIEDGLVMVAHPKLVAQMGRSRRDLRKLPFIHDEQLANRPVPTWTDWFEAAKVPPVDTRRGLRFSSADHAIEAALQGAGLLLTHSVVVHDELATGRLVAPFDIVLPTRRAYYLVHPKARQSPPALTAFRAWVKGEMRKMRRAPARN